MYLYGIPGIVFLILTMVLGWSIVGRARLPLKDLELMIASPIAGVISVSWVCVAISLVSGSIDTGIAITVLLIAITITLLRPWKICIKPVKEHLPAIMTISLLSFIFMFSGLLLYFDGEYHIAFPLYGDAAYHTSIMTSFSEGHNLPPVYPMMDGQPLRYTFLIDFYSAILDRLGLGIQWSMVLPGWILLSSLLSLLYLLGTRFTGKAVGGILSVILLVLSGGLGFIAAFQDWLASSLTITEFLAHSNLNYTCNYELGYVFTNFIIIVMAQRTALIGFAAGILIILLFYAMLVNRPDDEIKIRNGLLFAGVIAGLLPMFHVYSYICIMASSTLLLLLFREKKWYYFMVPAVLLALPQVYWISGQIGESFIRLQLWWMAGSATEFPAFWAKNMGFGLILLIAGLFLVSRKNLKFYLPFLAIFAMANIIVFQPWDYDNHKFFSFWLMPSVLLMASTLLYVYEIPKIGKPVFITFLLLSVFTGALVAAFMIGHPYTEFSQDDIYVSGWIKENTPKDAVFLTSNTCTHPVTTLSGRKSYLGYEGWLYTHGLDYYDRVANVRQMYLAQDANDTMRLLDQNNIDYVFVGPTELSPDSYRANEDFYRTSFRCVFNWTSPWSGGSYHIYEVPKNA